MSRIFAFILKIQENKKEMKKSLRTVTKRAEGEMLF